MQMRVFWKCLGIGWLLWAGLVTVQAAQPDRERLILLAKVDGFLLAQDYMLERIGHTYPQLRGRATEARADFDESFGAAAQRLRDEFKVVLKDYPMSADERKRLSQQFLEAREVVGRMPLNPQIAEQYLSAVKVRARGEAIAPDVLVALKTAREGRSLGAVAAKDSRAQTQATSQPKAKTKAKRRAKPKKVRRQSKPKPVQQAPAS